MRHPRPSTRAFDPLLPMLLAGRFRRPGFDREPVAVAYMPRRRRWGHLCEQVELPPPLGFASNTPVVQSVVLCPVSAQAFELLVFTAPDAAAGELTRVAQRIAAIAVLTERKAPHLTIRLATMADLPPDAAAWCCVVAGGVPPLPDEAPLTADLLRRAPSSLGRLLALTGTSPTLTFSDALRPRPDLPGHSVESALARWSNCDAARQLVLLPRVLPVSLAQLVHTATITRAAALRTLRTLPPTARRQVRALLVGDGLRSKIPTALHSVLAAAIANEALHEEQRPVGWALTSGGVDLLTARTLDELRARATWESPALARPSPIWRRVAALVEAGGGAHTLAVVEPGFVKHLIVTLPRHGRPRARRVDAPALMRQLLAARSRGDRVEVVSATGCDPMLAARLTRISRSSPVAGAIAIQLGDRLLIARAGTTRTVSLAAALARPRQLNWLPEDASLAVAMRRPMAAGGRRVHATVWPLGTERAAIFYVDDSGHVLREEVERAHLEPHLQETRDLLRQAKVPVSFSVTVSPQLIALGGLRMSQSVAPVLFSVESDGPFSVSASCEAERFGRGGLPWSAAAQFVLSKWPPGASGRVGVSDVRGVRQDSDVSGLQLLAVRSQVARRISQGVARLTRRLQAA